MHYICVFFVLTQDTDVALHPWNHYKASEDIFFINKYIIKVIFGCYRSLNGLYCKSVNILRH